MENLSRLIKKIAGRPSTEELILFIAGDRELVKECLELQKQLEQNDSQYLARVDSLCRNHQITREILSREVRRILAIFSPESVHDEYAVLGLDAGASMGEVKQAFRRLSVQYHPDSSGADTGDKFIEICQAYKTIISRSQHRNSGSSRPDAAAWRYKRKKGPSSRWKRKNVYIYSVLAGILFIISLIAPFMYKKKVMLQHLNAADPVIAFQPRAVEESTSEQPAESELNTAADKDNIDNANSAAWNLKTEPDTVPSLPVTSAADLDEPTPDEIAVIFQEPAGNSQPVEPAGTFPINKQQEIAPAVQPALKDPAPAEPIKPEELVAVVEEQESVAPAIKTEPPEEKKTSTQPLRPKEKKSKPASSSKIVHAQPPVPALQPAKATPPDPAVINTFLDTYTATYEQKNYRQFARFFSSDALENGHPFAEQEEKYNRFFQSVDRIHLTIGILSTSIEDEQIRLKGRFRIRLIYPEKQPFTSKGQISLLLTNTNNTFKVRELSYSFEK
jgi:hypothetical protein